MSRKTSFIQLISFCILLISMQSCFEPTSGPKPTSTIIQGTILQVGTLSPVEGALIELSVSYSAGGTGGGTIKYAVDSAYTNEDGVYFIETEIDPSDNSGVGGFFQITELSHPNYFSGTYLVEASGISYLQEVTKNAELTPHAYINLRLVNSLSIAGDYINISFVNENFAYELSPNEMEFDTILLVSGENSIRQRIKRKLNPTQDEIERDTIYLEAFQTKELTFEY